MSEWFTTVLQGVLQGLTEYLPVSSSGHLALFQYFTDFRGAALSFDVLLHLATVLATICYFHRDIFQFSGEFLSGFVRSESRRSEGWRFGWAVVVGTIVTAVVGLPIKGLVETATGMPRLVGGLLLVTALVTFLPTVIYDGHRSLDWKAGLMVGLAQGIAVLPGVSRSGATIVAALFWGLSRQESFRFSFLLSLPAIIGAAFLELRHVSADQLPSGWMISFLAAFVCGLLALSIVKRVVSSGHWLGFSVYCAIVGLLAICFA